MMRLTDEQLASLRDFDTCCILNAIETFHLRLRTEGYVYPGLQCFGDSLLGYAITARVKASHPPPTNRPYFDRTDWWSDLADSPGPLVAVFQDIDDRPGMGAVVGGTHAAIMKRLNCVGLITNGAVRDLAALRQLRFSVFAASIIPSHGYVHLVDRGVPVEINSLEVQPGALLYGDEHGVITIPLEIAQDIPRVAEEQRKRERKVIDLCASPKFSLDQLREAVK